MRPAKGTSWGYTVLFEPSPVILLSAVQAGHKIEKADIFLKVHRCYIPSRWEAATAIPIEIMSGTLQDLVNLITVQNFVLMGWGVFQITGDKVVGLPLDSIMTLTTLGGANAPPRNWQSMKNSPKKFFHSNIYRSRNLCEHLSNWYVLCRRYGYDRLERICC